MTNNPVAKDSGSQTAMVGPDNSAIVTCPHCSVRYKVDAWKVKTRGRKSKVKCKCGQGFSVFFEFRENPRRQLHVNGYYRIVKEVHVRGHAREMAAPEPLKRMMVRNISRTGIGFVALGKHELKVGDTVEVAFKLDDADQSRIERTAVVRRIADDHYFGCEFTDIGHFDKDTGFYVTT